MNDFAFREGGVISPKPFRNFHSSTYIISYLLPPLQIFTCTFIIIYVHEIIFWHQKNIKKKCKKLQFLEYINYIFCLLNYCILFCFTFWISGSFIFNYKNIHLESILEYRSKRLMGNKFQ